MAVNPESNVLLASFASEDRKFLEQRTRYQSNFAAGKYCTSQGDDVVTTYFPEAGTIISLVARTLGDHGAEAVMIGY